VSKKDKDLTETMKETLAESIKRDEAEYDGLSGSLPYWAPEDLKSDFMAVRGSLLNEYGEDAVREFLEGRKRLLTSSPNGYVRTSYIPPNIYSNLDTLIYIQRIVALGKEDGLKVYLGKGGIKICRGIAYKETATDAGKASGKSRRKEVEKRNKYIARTGRSLLAEGTTLPHELVSKISSRVDLSKKQIRNILQDQGVIEKRKNKRN